MPCLAPVCDELVSISAPHTRANANRAKPCLNRDPVGRRENKRTLSHLFHGRGFHLMPLRVRVDVLSEFPPLCVPTQRTLCRETTCQGTGLELLQQLVPASLNITLDIASSTSACYFYTDRRLPNVFYHVRGDQIPPLPHNIASSSSTSPASHLEPGDSEECNPPGVGWDVECGRVLIAHRTHTIWTIWTHRQRPRYSVSSPPLPNPRAATGLYYSILYISQQ